MSSVPAYLLLTLSPQTPKSVLMWRQWRCHLRCMTPDDVCISGTRICLNVAHIAASLWADWYIIRPPFAQCPGLNPGRGGCFYESCAYKELQTVQRSGISCAIHSTVHYKLPLTSFDKSRALSGLLASLCCDNAENDVSKSRFTLESRA